MEEKLKKFIDGEEGILKAIQRQVQYAGEYQELGSSPLQWLNIPRILQVIVSSRGIDPLKFTMDAGDVEIFCDPIIEKVFSRLVDNTRKHAKTATEIHVAWSETADGLRIVFEDNGVGIPSDKKKDLFVQGTGASSGLSLSFVHDILEISDMTIRECGEPGKGARFEISVPRGIFRLGVKKSKT